MLSFVILSGLTYRLWLSDKNLEYSSFGMSIHIILGCLLALSLGMIAIAKRPYTHKKSSTKSIYNFIGTFNVHIAIVGALFIYVGNVNHLSEQIAIFIVPLIIGLFVLKNIYFNK
jgi:uncharacterized membrane protein YjjP (DUF1212 family)